MTTILLTICLLPTDVTVSTLAGESTSGRLLRLTETELELRTDAASQVIPVESLVELRRDAPDHEALPAGQAYLLDGTVLSFDAAVTRATAIVLKSDCYQEVVVPLKTVRALRIAPRSASRRLDG